MTPLDQAYFWSINPMTGMDPSGNMGLGSLVPKVQLSSQSTPAPLNPYSNLPVPNFSNKASSNFSWIEPTVESGVKKVAQGTGDLGTTRAGGGAYPQTGSQKPYFDPNFPIESLQAQRNWLLPQVDAGAQAGLAARGIYSSGVGEYAKQDAENYLNQIAPQVAPQQALAMDLERLYGPNIVNSLMKGSSHQAGFGTYEIPSSLIGATPFGDGSTTAQAAFIQNPNYNPAQNNNDFPTYPEPPAGRIGLLGLTPQAAQQTQATQAVQGAQPQYGLYDYSTNQAYSTPGYWYDPSRMPDASKMPWLSNALNPNSNPEAGGRMYLT